MSKNQGITLVELVVSFTITTVLVSLIVSFIFIGSKQYRKILRKQRWISQTILFRNILEENLLFLHDSEMHSSSISFEGKLKDLSFHSLQESSKGILKRKVAIRFLKESGSIRLLISRTDVSQEILVKKDMKGIENMHLSYFDPLKFIWKNKWDSLVFYPKAISLTIKHRLFKDPIIFVMDIFYGKSL